MCIGFQDLDHGPSSADILVPEHLKRVKMHRAKIMLTATPSEVIKVGLTRLQKIGCRYPLINRNSTKLRKPHVCSIAEDSCRNGNSATKLQGQVVPASMFPELNRGKLIPTLRLRMNKTFGGPSDEQVHPRAP